MLNTSIGTLQDETPFSVMASNEVPTFKKAVQKGFKKKDPDPMNFKQLPREVLEDIGETTRVGTARMELAILSHLCMSRAKTKAGEVQYEQGFIANLGEGQFIQTIETTAEDIGVRWHVFESRSDMYEPSGSRKREFDTFYKRIQRGFQKLRHWGWIHKIDYVNPQFKGVYGTVWNLDTRLELCIENLPNCPDPSPLLVSAEVPADGVYVNAVDRTGKHFLSESAEEYVVAECTTSVYDRGTYYRHDEWCNAVAENQINEPRHVSIGAFKPGFKWIDETTPCTVPWVILEPEDGDLSDRYNAVSNILDTLHAEGVDISPIVVTFSANKSFHIRIPQGMFGSPVYRSVEDCIKVLNRFAMENFEERLDVDLFDPRHLVRCTGSLHEETGGRVVAFTGYEFLNLTFNQVLSYLGTGTVKNPHAESPRKAPASAWLTDRLIDASDSFSRFWIPASSDVSTDPKATGAFAAAMRGCAEGEQWHEKHIGRSKLVFVAACYLLKKLDELSAFDELEKVNRKNDPPLSPKEVKNCFVSAQRTLARKTK